jgi:glycerol-3-phosphate dehydrogenase
VRRQDVLSTWSGIRPLAADPTKQQQQEGATSSIVRDHVIFQDADGLVTVGDAGAG